MVNPFLTAAEMHEFDPLIAQGWDTVQAFFEPQGVTIRRRGPSGWGDVTTLTPIKIDLQGSVVPFSQDVASEVTSPGIMRLYVEDGEQVQRDDRFTIDDNTYVIGLVEPDDNHGTTLVTFTMLEG